MGLPVDAWSQNDTQNVSFFGKCQLFCTRKAKIIGVALFLTCAIGLVLITSTTANGMQSLNSVSEKDERGGVFGCKYASFRDEMECFRSCDGLPFVDSTCYTTTGDKDDFTYVSCNWATDCNSDWDCAGLCLPF